jgi:carbon storage regulator CsrA
MALVLGRKSGERVWVGNDVCVEVVSIRGNKVRLAFHAHPSVPILRSEVKEADERREKGK